MTFSPTQEQARCADLYRAGHPLKIQARAGTGKTSTLLHLVNIGSSRGGRVLYTSFGSKVIADAKVRFPQDKAKVATNHALAYAVTGRLYQSRGRLQSRVMGADLIQRFGWTDRTFAPHADVGQGAWGVLDAINRFCQSADPAVQMRHAMPAATWLHSDAAPAQAYAKVLCFWADAVWLDMVDSASPLPVTHDVYLKQWALTNPTLPYSVILLDEAQDTSGLMIGLLRKQQHAQLVVVGDSYQGIYGWRGAISAMDAFPITACAELTQSFRFGDGIAQLANAVLRNHVQTDARVRGLVDLPSTIGALACPRATLARSNCGLIGALIPAALDAPASCGVVGGVDDLIRLIQGAEGLMRGQRTKVAELAEFHSWPAVLEASKQVSHRHLSVLVSLVTQYGCAFLLRILESVRGNERDESRCTRLFSTAHKAKGREFDSIVLEDDFVARPGAPDANSSWTPEESHLLYVAITRARHALDPTRCTALRDAWGTAVWPS